MFEAIYSSILEEGSVEELEVLLKNFLELSDARTNAGKKVGDLTDELCFKYQYPSNKDHHQEVSNPLEVAAYHGHIPLLQKLLDIGVEFRKKDTFSPLQDIKLSLLSKAAQNNKVNVIEWLVEKKLSTHPNIFNQNDFNSALRSATEQNNFAAFKALLNANMLIDYDNFLAHAFGQPSINIEIVNLLLRKRGLLLIPPTFSQAWAVGFCLLPLDYDIKLLLRACSDLPFQHLYTDKQKKIASLIVQNIIEDSNGDGRLIRKNLLSYLVKIEGVKESSLRGLIFDFLSEIYPQYANLKLQRKLVNTALRIQHTMISFRFNFEEAWFLGVDSNTPALLLLCGLALMKDDIILTASKEILPIELFRHILEIVCKKDLAQKDEDATSANIEAFFKKAADLRQQHKLTRTEEIEKIKLYLNAVSAECLEKKQDNKIEFVVKAIAVIIRIPSGEKRAELYGYCATLPVATKGMFATLPTFFENIAKKNFNEAEYREKKYYDYQDLAIRSSDKIIEELKKFLQVSVAETASTKLIKKTS